MAENATQEVYCPAEKMPRSIDAFGGSSLFQQKTAVYQPVLKCRCASVSQRSFKSLHACNGLPVISRKRHWRFCGVSVLALLMIIGCDGLIPPRPPLGQPPADAARSDALGAVSDTGTQPELPLEEFKGDWEDWYVHRIGSQVVGISHVMAESILDAESLVTGKADVRFERTERFLFRTGSTQFVRRVQTTSVERHDGTLESFETEATTGPVTLKIQGKQSKGKLKISVFGDTVEKTDLAWEKNYRGLFAIEQTLRRRPIVEGETRKLPGLTPSMKGIGAAILSCKGKVSVGLLDGTYKLLNEVEVQIVSGDQVSDELVIWVDESGVMQKSLRPEMRIESLRATREEAQDMFGERDDGEVSVSVKGVLKRNARPIQVAFVIVDSELAEKSSDSSPTEAESGNANGSPDRGVSASRTGASRTASQMISPAVGQAIRPVEDGLQVLAFADGIPMKGFQGFDRKVDATDTQQTTLIDFRHPSVARMSQVLGEMTKRELLGELSSMTKNVLSLSTQQGLRSASSIIRSGKGGELDHAVVLTSLLRARGIPACIAYGLKAAPVEPTDRYTDEPGRRRSTMTLSSWVVASIDGTWFTVDPLTAKMNQADRLCLKQTSGDADLAAELAAVFRRIADIEIEIRGARYFSDE